MNTGLLSADKDPMGAAILDYFEKRRASRLRVFSSQFDEDEIPVPHLFRSHAQMSPLEQEALSLATGRILDAGAGSGCHSLALRDMGKETLAIDISPLSVEVMRRRGLQALQANLLSPSFAGSFDTVLMLMNGSGIIGRLQNMQHFFRRIRALLAPGGCVLMDSSDLRYLYEDEEGGLELNLAGDYYGEIDYTMQYRNVRGDAFDWLYVDFDTLALYAGQNGFEATLLKRGAHYDYLARLTLR